MTGGVGSRLAARLIEQGDQVVGLHRHTEQAHTLESDGTEPVLGDLTSLSVDTPAARLKGADAAVFTAGASGAGPRQAHAVDGQGVEFTGNRRSEGRSPPVPPRFRLPVRGSPFRTRVHWWWAEHQE
ncbi:NAD(P)H-binding protein [Streptomyces sp. NBC_00310]|uniref:NAD(P)H-binding protein n=1 Tax=Streptomyces sp. NBC_00310 TaxID=2903645 RepID=UPI002E23442D